MDTFVAVLFYGLLAVSAMAGCVLCVPVMALLYSATLHVHKRNLHLVAVEHEHSTEPLGLVPPTLACAAEM